MAARRQTLAGRLVEGCSLHVMVEYRAIVFVPDSSEWIMVRDEENIYSLIKLIRFIHPPGRTELYKVLGCLESTGRETINIILSKRVTYHEGPPLWHEIHSETHGLYYGLSISPDPNGRAQQFSVLMRNILHSLPDTERPELNLPPPERQYSSTPLESRVESNNSCATSALGDVACSDSQETPTEVFTESQIQQRNEKCGICWEMVQKPCRLGCGHSFCSSCIGKWTWITASCPLCREALMPTTAPADHGDEDIFYDALENLPAAENVSTDAQTGRTSSDEDDNDVFYDALEALSVLNNEE